MKPYVLLFNLVLTLGSFAASAHAPQSNLTLARADKIYLKLRSEEVPGVRSFNYVMEPLNFGLSETQKNQILELTDGRINFNDLYILKFQQAYSLQPKTFKQWLSQRAFEYGHKNIQPPVMAPTKPDPKLVSSWWIDKLEVPKAWPLATGKGVTIADCDAGYYINESDIRGNLLLQFARDFSNSRQPGVVNDGEYTFHGTSVAAIMAGVLDGKGTNGIAYNAKVVPFQNFNYNDSDEKDKEVATAECILEGIKTPNVDIIVLENQTHGSSETFEGTRLAVRLALESGITIVSAGGNSSNELKEEQADDTGSIIVGALNKRGNYISFSNYGARVSIAAFGEQLYTLAGPNGSFKNFSGTSGATPQVAATVALMLEANPQLTPEQIKQILIQTRITNSSNKKVGGQVNAYAAVSKAKVTEGNPDERARQQHFRRQLVSILRD